LSYIGFTDVISGRY